MQFRRRRVADAGLLVLVNAMWAGQYPAYKTATRQAGPVALSIWTFLIASLVLTPFLIRERRASAQPPAAFDWKGFLLLALFGLVPGSALLAWGTELSTASNAALLYLTLPMITAVMAVTLLGERMTLVRWGSLGLSLLGVLIVSGSDWRHAELHSMKFLGGNLIILVAIAGSAFYNVHSKNLLRRFTPLEVLVFGYMVSAVISVPILIGIEPASLGAIASYTVAVWVSLLVLSVFSWGLAMVLWMHLLRRLDVSQASVSIYLLPLLGVLFSALILKERITTAILAGGLLTLAGTFLITSADSPPAAQEKIQ
jgi:drug/metabolite transporter (DMT)-like permease